MKTIFRLKNLVILITLGMFCFYGCSTEEALNPEAETSVDLMGETQRAGHGRVIHHVNLGTNDVCEAFGLPNGCDGNFSLTANLHEDGFVRGQWQDTFLGGGEGIHVSIDCANFGEANGFKWAIVSGVITKGQANGVDVSGQRAVTLVADYGPGLGNDFMSFSIFPENADCNNLTPNNFPDVFIIPVSTGEAVVW